MSCPSLKHIPGRPSYTQSSPAYLITESICGFKNHGKPSVTDFTLRTLSSDCPHPVLVHLFLFSCSLKHVCPSYAMSFPIPALSNSISHLHIGFISSTPHEHFRSTCFGSD